MTTVTVSQLRTWDPVPFTQAAAATEENCRRIAAAEESFARAFYDATRWEGQARRAAGVKTDEELAHSRRVRGLLAELAEALTMAGREFSETRSLIQRKGDDARACGCAVHDDGRVTGGDRGQASLLQQQIQGALARAARADADTAKKLREIGQLLARPAS